MIVIFLAVALKYNPDMYGAYGITGQDTRHKTEIYEQIDAMNEGWA